MPLWTVAIARGNRERVVLTRAPEATTHTIPDLGDKALSILKTGIECEYAIAKRKLHDTDCDLDDGTSR
jgi:hypothetical protein